MVIALADMKPPAERQRLQAELRPRFTVPVTMISSDMNLARSTGRANPA